MVDKMHTFFNTKTVALTSVLVLSIIGFYINPFVFNVYKEAQVDMPIYIFNFVKYNGWELLGWWAFISGFVFLKDIFFKKRFIIYINILLILTLLVGFSLFIKGIEPYHWPLWGL